jgi:hypothetical protein
VSNRKAPTKFPLLVLRGRIYCAKMRVPADVKATLGKSVFVQSTGEEDPLRAMVKAQPFIDRWKAQIEEVRSGKALRLQDRILKDRKRVAQILRDAHSKGPDSPEWDIIMDLLEDEGYDTEEPTGKDPKQVAIIE